MTSVSSPRNNMTCIEPNFGYFAQNFIRYFYLQVNNKGEPQQQTRHERDLKKTREKSKISFIKPALEIFGGGSLATVNRLQDNARQPASRCFRQRQQFLDRVMPARLFAHLKNLGAPPHLERIGVVFIE
jgi:hypothetical protein